MYGRNFPFFNSLGGFYPRGNGFPLDAPSLDPRKPSGTGYTSKVRVRDKYRIVGFISSGTYGRVYKAIGKNGEKREFAIKKFKPDKEGEIIQYTGLSQSAIREMSLCSELDHPNVVQLEEIILEDKCIFMVFEYTEHDLLQIIHHHTQPQRHAIPAPMVRSILFQLLNGLLYLHTNWVLHRDLKPANILVTSSGAIRVGDLGLARLFYKPLNSLFSGDKVVVTIWYRAPELLMGSRHYTPAVDLWAVGCIFAELLSLRPIFKGEEAKMDSKKTVPFQRNQMMKIIEIMGLPTKEIWPGITSMPEFSQLQSLAMSRAPHFNRSSNLENWYQSCLKNGGYSANSSAGTPGADGFDLLSRLLEYDPTKRITAREALEHPYFKNGGPISANCFEGFEGKYPHRRVTQDDNDIRSGSLPGTKRSGLPDDSLMGRASKRIKE
ncbi:meiotic mRNA stability protein kinase UME5 [Aspergillus terreus NIH2624]|uniref:Serine/threonine-protein kinase ssn3 n=1 Tax=Aspergillus terreus (strain NIH 2624 / FGSC A1156) TaxID=341663 RepID=SSN3_ASPTN|nr:meiotic mRNA stability protein kinase UME5 [Aspergillus terreus NIH2624]Q0CQK1.1 RecName: Full=Serine/threonine-protein kinase ssn3; AltName: Full=Cyclin-dependent kinase 8 [Aspergillus terreus NIH2624]EAU35835.1 meiotic mRNA stability protein kinase UME5 [Aspergillus terreus NIH2624]